MLILLSQENTMLILNSHPETSTFSKCVVSFESLLWISVLFNFLYASFPVLCCPRTLIAGNHLSSSPLSGVRETGNIRAQPYTLICPSASPPAHPLWNCSSVAGDRKAQQSILTGLADIFNCLSASLQPPSISQHWHRTIFALKSRELSLHFNEYLECMQFAGTVYF